MLGVSYSVLEVVSNKYMCQRVSIGQGVRG